METRRTVESAVLKFISQPGIFSVLTLLAKSLPEEAGLYLVGGAIRNLVIQRVWGRTPKTEDIDLFIGGLPDDFSLKAHLKREEIERTDLDGIRWHPKASGFAFDICLLQNFLVFQKYRLEPTCRNLLDCIDFSVNAVVFDVTADRLLEKNCIASIEKQCLDFNTHRYFTKQLLAYRILLIRHKTGFRVSEAVYSFIKGRLSLSDLSDLKALFTAKLGNKKARVLMADYDRICAFRQYENYESQWARDVSGSDY